MHTEKCLIFYYFYLFQTIGYIKRTRALPGKSLVYKYFQLRLAFLDQSYQWRWLVSGFGLDRLVLLLDNFGELGKRFLPLDPPFSSTSLCP